MERTQLDKIKRRLGIDVNDTLEDDLLNDLVEDAESYFLGLANASSVDDKYNYIIENVVYKMYQRKGSEAVKSENVDGYSVTYEDWDDYFKPYLKIIDRDFGDNGTYREKGKVMFY